MYRRIPIPISRSGGHAVAIGSVALVAVAVVALRSVAGPDLGVSALLIPIILAAGLGGLQPGLLATGLAAAAGAGIRVAAGERILTADWILLLGAGGLVTLLSGVLHRALAQARRQAPRSDQGGATHDEIARARDVLRLLIEQAPVSIAMLDRNMVYLATSLQWQAEFSRGQVGLVGRSHYEIHPDLPGTWRRIHRECLAGAVRSAEEDYWVQDDGSEHWVRWAIHPWRDDAGGIGGIIMFAEDVTPRKRAVQALQSSEQRYRDLVHLSPMPVLVDRAGRIEFASPAAAALFGAESAEELVGRSFREAVHRDDLALIADQLTLVASGAPVAPIVHRIVRRDGTARVVESMASVFTDERGSATQVVLHDITDRQQAETSIRERELRLAAVVNSAMDGIITIDEQQRIELVNPAAETIFGYPAADLLGQSLDRLIPSRFHADHRKAVRQFGTSGRTHRSMGNLTPLVGLRASGEEFPIEATISQSDLGGRKLYTVILRDLSDRRRTEQALRHEEERFRQLAEAIREVFWLTDIGKGQIVYISPAYEAIWGRTCEELYQNPMSWMDAIIPADRDRIMRAAVRQAEGGYNEEYQISRPDGTIRWIHDQAFPVRDASGQVVRIAGVAEDVTARRELEDQLRQTQKMESIGLLAGGVAHDFNNLLTVIAGSAEMLSMELTPEHRGYDLVQEIQHAGRRAAALTRQLLAFSRQEVVESRLVDLADVVADTEKMLRRLIGEDVTLTTSLARTPCRVRIDPGQWTQVLLNLAVNARDAMPKGGRLEIATSVVDLDSAFERSHPTIRPGRYVKLTVADTGSGMGEEVRTRVFEPFFTTKARGQGTGLGLAVVHGIVHQSGGHVEVASEEGVGSTFTIYLPAVEETSALRVDQTRRTPMAGLETVLLVEDEEAVRRIATRALQANGYRVIGAADGHQALAALSGYRGRIALIITDVVMPNMDGADLAQRVRALHPDMRVLFTSGYFDDTVGKRGIFTTGSGFLPKPYAATVLLRRVREVLDGPPAGPPATGSNETVSG
ncbi:MAG: PAS domain S-box protein [Gemmatimonadales bacterium]|nr:PAS domain S-box protein [Gemmatimonadales bacterium]